MLGAFLDLKSVDRNELDLTSLSSVLPDWQFYEETDKHEVLERIRDVDVVVVNKVVLDQEILSKAEKLRLVCVAATGTDNVDLKTASKRGISVCNVRAYATPSVVQHVFMLVLSLVTRVNDYSKAIKGGKWQNSKQFCLLDYPITELAGKKFGIVGYGELGKAVARVAEAFGMEVLIAARKTNKGEGIKAGRLPLNDILRQVDVLSLHCPLVDETRGLIGENELSLMKPSAILINTARGGIVDETALAMALKQKRLGGAGIDVLTEEPPINGNPLLDDTIPDLILTPHIAWASQASRQRLINEIVFNIQSWKNGELRNSVIDNSL